MAEIVQGAGVSWREWCQNLNATITLGTVSNYIRSGHTCLGSPTVTVDTAFPLSNLLDRRLAKYARLICTPAQDVGSGGNNRWYYATFQIKVALSYSPLSPPNTGYPANTIGLLATDARYPSIEPNVCYPDTNPPGGYYYAPQYDVYATTAWGTSVFQRKPVGMFYDGGTSQSIRPYPQINGYAYPASQVYFFTRAAVGSAIVTFGPACNDGSETVAAGANAGLASNPGTAYITIGRLWFADSLIVDAGSDAYWKMKPVDSSIVRRSRGQQIYTDQYARLRSMDFSFSALTDAVNIFTGGGPYDPGFAIGGTSQHVPGVHQMALEAGVSGEVLIIPRISYNAGGSPRHFGLASQIYGTIAPPGLSIDDQSGGFTKASGTIIESR